MRLCVKMMRKRFARVILSEAASGFFFLLVMFGEKRAAIAFFLPENEKRYA